VAARRLHEALLSAEQDSTFWTGDSPPATGRYQSVGPSFLRSRPDLRFRLDRAPLRLFGRQPTSFFSTNWIGSNLPSRLLRSSDVLSLHWIGGGFVRIEAISNLSIPVVWTLHDSWPFTGGCHLPGSCEEWKDHCTECKVLASAGWPNLAAAGWRRKMRAYSRAQLRLVSPSRFLASKAEASSLLGNAAPVTVIPNGIDPKRFRPVDRLSARHRLGLPGGRRLVLFAASGGVSDPNKGFDVLARAIRGIPAERRPTLLIAGGPPPHDQSGLLPMIGLGELNEAEMILAYGASDIVAVPSLEENFPNTILEAFACGRAVVASRVGGIPELIIDGKNGALFEAGNDDCLARTLMAIEKNDRLGGLAREARRHAEVELSLELQAERYLRLFSTLTAGSPEPCPPT
jgi:glycosyltransferase involved in cell wall biosynthesis